METSYTDGDDKGWLTCLYHRSLHRHQYGVRRSNLEYSWCVLKINMKHGYNLYQKMMGRNQW